MTDAVPTFTDGPGTDLDPDDDLAVVGTASTDGRSQLEAMREDFAAPVTNPPVTIEVPGRPGYQVRFDTDVPYGKLDAFNKRATNRKTDDTDMLRVSLSLVAAQCEAIRRGGEDVIIDGAPMTFQTRLLHEIVGAPPGDYRAAIRLFFGRDADIVNAAGAIVEGAGWTDDAAVDVDPTTA